MSGLLLNSVLDKNDKKTERKCRVFEGNFNFRTQGEVDGCNVELWLSVEH